MSSEIFTSLTTSVPVRGNDRVSGYDVLVGQELYLELPNILGKTVQKVLLISTSSVSDYVESVKEFLSGFGYKVLLAEVPDGDLAKNVQVLEFCWQVLAQSNFSRRDMIVSIGGGAVSDLAGMVAATWLRGVPIVHMPTTILGMVDASVGGKNSINMPEGKNLVGSFYNPVAVLADLSVLATLPKYELLAGMAEVVKAGFIADSSILEIFESHNFVDVDYNLEVFKELILRSIRVKTDIVSADFWESSGREFLNYGHTLAHAVEFAERYRFRHGAAISIGMMFAAELGRLLGRTSDVLVDRHRDILVSLGLPVGYDGSRWEQLLAAMLRDKKVRGGVLRFVVLHDVGKPVVVEAPDVSFLFSAFQEIVL